MKGSWDVEYPCGLKTKGSYSFGWFDIAVVDIKKLEPCPIHGLKCSRRV